MKRRIALTDSRLRPETERGLRLRGFEVITLPEYYKLSAPVSAHTDMLLLPLRGEVISFADYCDVAPYVFCDLQAALPRLRFSFISEEPAPEYPKDVLLNALLFKDKLFARAKSLAPLVVERCRELGIRIIDVKQGYPACTVLRLSDNAAITADEGMAAALSAEAIRVTLIKGGGVLLPPYEYGFIGGAAGVLADTVYFAGNLATHPDAEKIRLAIEAEGMKCVSLSEGALQDLGGIFLAEEEA